LVTAIGYLAAALTATAFFPQVVKALRTRSTADLSLMMLACQSTGVALWIVYGVAIRSPPVIAANIVTLMLAVTLLLLKWADRRP
jgi:MtN3 and saliva related transmembrane protein